PDTIHPLTSLRFFAALWVVLFHYWPHLQGVVARPALIEHGTLGVELFFTLSGFILCHVYLRSLENQRFSYGNFLWNRLARVYPLHLATLAAMGAMGLAATVAGISIDPNILSWSALPANLTLTQAWGLAKVAGWNHPSWSISAEWFAYLCFPLFGLIAMKLRDRPRLGVALALALIALLYPAFQALAGFPLTLATIAWGALRIVPCFFLGTAMHGVWRAGLVKGRAAGFALSGAALALIVATAMLNWNDMVANADFGALILGLDTITRSGSSFATQKPLIYLGEISYSIYMVCTPWGLLVFNAAEKLLHIDGDQLPLAVWLAAVVGIIPLAALSYHFIEHPAREWMKQFAKTVGKRRMAAVAA
ncbi:MAG: acyltransferase 3, partial [Caulobacteraceae bacterium]|nr:acyltransferase 3 [Caulobacteraceae bacterium]